MNINEEKKRQAFSNFSKTACIYYKLMQNSDKEIKTGKLKDFDEEEYLRLGSVISSVLTYDQDLFTLSKEYNVNMFTLIQALGYANVNYDDISNVDITDEDEFEMSSFIINESETLNKFATIANTPVVLYLANTDNGSPIANAIDEILYFNEYNANGKKFDKVELLKEINNVRKSINSKNLSNVVSGRKK